MFFLPEMWENEATEAAQQSFSVEVEVSIRVDIFIFTTQSLDDISRDHHTR
jgi:hypothetical protein